MVSLTWYAFRTMLWPNRYAATDHSIGTMGAPGPGS